MNKMKQWLVAGVSVFILSLVGLSPAQVVHEETKFGASAASPSVTTTGSLTGVNGNLYLAAITSKPKLGVTSVTGLGLDWKPVKSQCSGRNATNVQVWMAQGTPTGNGTVTATFSDSAKNAIIIVSRYSGVHATFPLGGVISGNTTGTNGPCTGGIDNISYLFNLTTGSNGAFVYGAIVMRAKTHEPGPGFMERAELINGTGGDVVSLAAEDKSVPVAATVTVDGTFNGNVDWALVALEIRPASATGGPSQYTLTTNTEGLGSVDLNPAGGTYDAGTEVTLKAVPVAGFQFSGWSGDLTSSANPVKIVVNADKHVIATFKQVIPTYRLNVNTVGNGSVTINPTGGSYKAGTKVTLTAKPAPGYVFGGWKGALTGLTSPREIVMNANQTVIATFTGGTATGKVLHKETKFGVASNSLTVTTSENLLATNGQLYLAAISSKPKLGVVGVSGLGLNWTPVKVQCSGRNYASVQIWMAIGTPTGNSPVTATFSDSVLNAVIVVSRYFGVHAAKPLGNVISGNTMGLNGACSGGVDINKYLLNMNTTVPGSVVYCATTMRSKTQTPGVGYAERAESQQGSGNDIVSVAVEDKSFATAAKVAIDGSFDAATDWAAVAIELRPAGALGGNIKFSLTTNTVGSGTVGVNPTSVDGNYLFGSTVTLTATPAAGFKFSGWSGDVANSANPVTIVMNAHKIVTGNFTALPPTLYKLVTNTLGHGNVVLNPPGGTYKAGTVVTVMAVPDSGSKFTGWDGDLTSSASPDSIVMNSNKNLRAKFTGSLTDGNIVSQEIQTGASANSSTTATSLPLTAVNGDLYVAAIATKPKLNVLSVTGLGLNWTPVVSKCSGRNISGVEVWVAQGTPTGNDVVTASAGSPASNMILMVSRYSGAALTNPIGNVIAANTTGSTGACAGGVDSPSYSLNLTTTVPNALVFSAATMRSKTHSPGVGYTERVELLQGTGGNSVSLALQDKHVVSPAAIVVDGKFTGVVDWAVVAFEIKPRPYKLTINTVGLGTVKFTPADSLYAPGTVVTLKATAATNSAFIGWSGDLTSTANPVTITMTGDKNVTATFKGSADVNVNLATKKPITASGSDASGPAENAVDGDIKNTYWRSLPLTTSSPTAWLRVDLGTAQAIGRVVIRWKSSYFPKSYEVQVATNDTSWTKVYSTTSGKKGTLDVKFPSVTARYVRINMIKNSTSSYRILEIEVYPAVAGAAKGVVEVTETEEIPTEIYLAQNYPNPFNPSTAIEYGLPEGTRVTLKVFNLTGQLVATLANGFQEAGHHEVIFNASRLPSGNYFMVLQAGDFKQVRRMVLMK